MKNTIIKIAIIAAIIAAVVISFTICISKYNKLYNDWQVSVANEKAYSSRIMNLTNDCREFQFTIDQLNYSNDSIVKKLMDAKKELRIKDKNIKELEYLLSEFHITDSITFHDTIFVNSFMLDTIVGDEWMNTNLRLKYPNEIYIKSQAKSEKNVLISAKRETINPPSKFFFIRWFQKKHEVIKVDVIENNPHISSEQNLFIKVID